MTAPADLVEAVAKAIRAEINRYWQDDTVEADDRTLGQAAIAAYQAHMASDDRLMERFNAFIGTVNNLKPEVMAKLTFGPEVTRLLDRLAAAAHRRTAAVSTSTIADSISRDIEAEVMVDEAVARMRAQPDPRDTEIERLKVRESHLQGALKNEQRSHGELKTEHRAAVAAKDAEIAQLRDALERVQKFVSDYKSPWGSWKTAWWEGEVSDFAAITDDNALMHCANIASPALAKEGK